MRPLVLIAMAVPLLLVAVLVSLRREPPRTKRDTGGGPVVVPEFAGRLGNRVFQVFAAMRYADIHGHRVVFCDKFICHNEKEEDSMEEVRRIFPSIPTVDDIGPYTEIDYRDSPYEFKEFPSVATSVVMKGHFQNVRYIPQSMQDSPPLQAKETQPHTYFIHVRAGDYLNNKTHFVDLRRYYKRCIHQIQQRDTKATFLVFSDDNPRADAMMREYDVPFRVSETKDTVDVLREMSSCSGAICANSSFSWLGAFFQKGRTAIYMPSVWIAKKLEAHERPIEGIYPPWATVMEI